MDEQDSQVQRECSSGFNLLIPSEAWNDLARINSQHMTQLVMATAQRMINESFIGELSER